MSGGISVWDYDPDLKTPDADPVSGRVHEQPGTAGPSALDLLASISLHIGRLAASEDRRQRARDRAAALIPGDPQITASGLYPSSGTLALDLGAPAMGTFWQVRGVTVGGQDISVTSIAGQAWVFIQGSAPNQNGGNGSIAQARDYAATLPDIAFYGTHQLVVTGTAHLWVVITNGTAATQYVASATIETFDISALNVSTYDE